MAADLSLAARMPGPLTGLLLLLPLLAQAAPPLGDPTRPPSFAAPAVEPGPRGAGRAGIATLPPPPAGPAPVLQSLQLGPGGASALVDGRLLRVGDRLGQRTVTAIDAQGLTLRSESGRSERLELLGGVVKHAVGAAPATGSVQARLHGTPTLAMSAPAAASASAPSAAPTSAPSAGRNLP